MVSSSKKAEAIPHRSQSLSFEQGCQYSRHAICSAACCAHLTPSSCQSFCSSFQRKISSFCTSLLQQAASLSLLHSNKDLQQTVVGVAVANVKWVLQVPYVPEGLEAIIFTADGDMRQALNNLQVLFPCTYVHLLP